MNVDNVRSQMRTGTTEKNKKNSTLTAFFVVYFHRRAYGAHRDHGEKIKKNSAPSALFAVYLHRRAHGGHGEKIKKTPRPPRSPRFIFTTE